MLSRAPVGLDSQQALVMRSCAPAAGGGRQRTQTPVQPAAGPGSVPSRRWLSPQRGCAAPGAPCGAGRGSRCLCRAPGELLGLQGKEEAAEHFSLQASSPCSCQVVEDTVLLFRTSPNSATLLSGFLFIFSKNPTNKLERAMAVKQPPTHSDPASSSMGTAWGPAPLPSRAAGGGPPVCLRGGKDGDGAKREGRDGTLSRFSSPVQCSPGK